MQHSARSILAGCFLLVAWLVVVPQAHGESASSLLTPQPYDRILGDSEAPVTMVEYSSLSCPHCAAFHEDIFPTLKERYIDTGKVKLIVRNFPLNAPALRGAMLTLCVPESRYYPYLKVLFGMQRRWAFSSEFRDSLKTIAKVGGMSGESFESCMKNKAIESKVLTIRRQANETLTIRATPTFYINGTKIQGSKELSDFTEVIEAAL